MNTIPFFTPLWAGIPVVMFMHQLAREVWWYESAFPLNAVGFLAEPIYLRCYRSVPVVTVSASTRDDLKRFGLRGPITVIPEGLEPASHVTVKGTSEPTALYVGRLTPSKRVADIILAFAKFCESVPSARLRLIGDGPSSYVAKLRKLAVDRGVADRVHFLGRVAAPQKHQEMASAYMLLVASVREGWGLVVTEANSFGAPAVAYDVPGLRDSIRNGDTGLLVHPSPDALAAAMVRLWREPDLHQRLASAGMVWSSTFSFDRTAEAFNAVIAQILGQQLPGTRGALTAGS